MSNLTDEQILACERAAAMDALGSDHLTLLTARAVIAAHEAKKADNGDALTIAYMSGVQDGRKAQEAQRQARQEPVAYIEGIDEYGPRLQREKHWVDVGAGAKLYTASQPVAQVQPLTDVQIETAVTNWFSEDWTITAARGMLLDLGIGEVKA